MSEDFNSALDAYLQGVQQVYNDHYTKSGYVHEKPPQIKIYGGRKYLRIAKINNAGSGQTSVHSFICLVDDPKKGETAGDVMKPSGWKLPAKHRRGNIFSPKKGLEALTPHGCVMYL